MALAAALAAAGPAVLASASPAAAGPAPYEAVYVPGSSQVGAAFFRVTVATGQVVAAWGAPANYTPIPEAAALPAGDYHLYLADQPATPDGKVWWAVARMDSRSGRFWILVGGGNQPFAWVEAAAPK
jgi:hypothetical protein